MFNPFKKKSEWQKAQEKVDNERAQEIMRQAEQARRLELAKEHGTALAEKKYGKFKQPSPLLNVCKVLGKIAYAGEEPAKKGKKKKNDTPERVSNMMKQLEDF